MLPYVILYNAVSLDGCITGFNADVELYYELASKWNIDAVLMGSNTILTGFNAKPGEIHEDNIETLKTRKKDSEDRADLIWLFQTLKDRSDYGTKFLKCPIYVMLLFYVQDPPLKSIWII